MRVVFIGATAGCGLHAFVKLLNATDAKHEAILLSRRPEEYKELLTSQHGLSESVFDKQVWVVKGDATKLDDVRNLFHIAKTAGADGTSTAEPQVHAIVTSVGGKPKFGINPLIQLIPPNICESAAKTLLEAIELDFPASLGPDVQPRVIAITSNGMGKSGHASLPLALKPMYSWMLKEPHADKEEMEKALHRAAKLQHPDFNPTLGDEPLKLHRLTILRPSLLTDGPCSDKEVRAAPTLKGAYFISRADVGRELCNSALLGGKWISEGVTLSY
ncbi:hypothetical protein OC846_000776 [Tilletia horrida]|uniref:NAD(P)-binding domain-containing protein n=1 Tax=Tilletia horrida TaxID=155126 RepID=A0AAN6GX54_9BASI|nr:hypothetical protein OC846_000776 [Tilletia horrida]KAK0567834.1 hypothetical protein OC861_002503 [Tilletia horrida]